MFKLSQRSLKKMEGIDESLRQVILLAIQITPVDFGVLSGLRTVDEQRALYAQGRTKPGKVVTYTMKSDHLTGRAVDLGAYDKGIYIPGNNAKELVLYDRIAIAMKESARQLHVDLTHGIVVKGKLTDIGHFAVKKKEK